MHPRLTILAALLQAIVTEISPSSEKGSFDFPKMLRLLADAIRPPDVDVRVDMAACLRFCAACDRTPAARSADLLRYHIPDVCSCNVGRGPRLQVDRELLVKALTAYDHDETGLKKTGSVPVERIGEILRETPGLRLSDKDITDIVGRCDPSNEGKVGGPPPPARPSVPLPLLPSAPKVCVTHQRVELFSFEKASWACVDAWPRTVHPTQRVLECPSAGQGRSTSQPYSRMMCEGGDSEP